MIRRLSCILVFISPITYAFSWQNLWQTPNQQAATFMKAGQYEKAQNLFETRDWKATAAYKAKDYQQAATLFNQLGTESGYYNTGNALAHLHRYEEAIAAYDKAIALNPANREATFNKKLIEDLLKKQQKSDKKPKSDHEKPSPQNNQKEQSQGQQKNQQQKQSSEKNQSKTDNKLSSRKKDNQSQQASKGSNNSSAKQSSKLSKEEKKQQSTVEREKQQAKEKWLQLIPDDPGGLLRQKFLRDYERRQRGWYP